MSAQAYGLDDNQVSAESADFVLSPEEVSLGERAALTFLDSVKPGDARRMAQEALDTLAAVISGGVCNGLNFPWQQVRPYHGAIALSIVKEPGAPASIQSMCCRHDDSRKIQVVPERFKPAQVQKMRTSLQKVMRVCVEMGLSPEDNVAPAPSSPAKGASRNAARSSKTNRHLEEGEVRALVAACGMDPSIAGARDAMMISLAFAHGLKTVDLIGISLDDLAFDNRTGMATLRVKPSGAKRAKRVPLENENLIALEDWLEARGRADGALFCPVGRGGAVEIKKLTAADMRAICDQRAEEAGVDRFSPNDLARSFEARHQMARKARKRSQQDESHEPLDSPLFGAVDQVDEEPSGLPERIQFPYAAHLSA